jgi:hypothetical protein
VPFLIVGMLNIAFFIGLLIVVMLNVVMLSGVAPSFFIGLAFHFCR